MKESNPESNLEQFIKGKLEHIEHLYEDGNFRESQIMIREEDGSASRKSFQGFIPESLLGREVSLCQRQMKRGWKSKLYQSLTAQFDNNCYLIEVRTKDKLMYY